MGKVLPKKKFFRSKIYSPKLAVGSHIDNVRHSLEHLIFSNEKETESVLLKKRIKVVVFITLISMAVGSFFSPRGKAEVATFYPTACLGGWNNPHHAEGMPETLDNTPSFSFANSAVLAKDVLADLYCGTFKGDIPTETVPKKIMLTIAWKGMTDAEVEPISGTSFASSSLDILDATSSPGFTLENASSSDASSTIVASTTSVVDTTTTNVQATTTGSHSTDTVPTPVVPETPPASIDVPKKEVAPVPLPEVVIPPVDSGASSSPQSLLFNIGAKILAVSIDSVYALDTTMATGSSNSSPMGSSSLETVVASSTLVATASTSDIASSTGGSLLDMLLGQKVTNPTLEVLYTLDGVTWMSLGKVRAEDMSYNVFEIPVTATSTWEDISNIQIKVASLLSTDKKPTIFIDGMALNVEYAKINLESQGQTDGKADQKRYDMRVDSMQGNISAVVATDTDQGTTLTVSTAPGSLSVYKDATGDVVYSSGIGSESLIMNSYMFDPGIFTVVVSAKENGCLGLTAKECEADKDSIGSANFTITPTVNTPTKYVHTE